MLAAGAARLSQEEPGVLVALVVVVQGAQEAVRLLAQQILEVAVGVLLMVQLQALAALAS